MFFNISQIVAIAPLSPEITILSGPLTAAIVTWEVYSFIPHSALQAYYKYTIDEKGALQPLLLLITINIFCNMYFYL